MLNPIQRQFIFDKILNTFTFSGAPVTVPKYRQQTELPDLPSVPYMAIGFPSEGVDLGFGRTAGPQRIYYDKVAGCYAWQYGRWYKATVSINMIDTNASRLETCMAELFTWLLSQVYVFGYPTTLAQANAERIYIKFGEILSANSIAFSFVSHKVKPERETYVSMLDFSVWYLATYVLIGPPMLTFDQEVYVPDKITYLDWVRGLNVDMARLNITGYMPGSYSLDMRVV